MTSSTTSSTTADRLTEFDIIRRYFTRETADEDVLIGVGDDAALLNPRGPVAVAVDTLVSGVHFPERTDADAVAHRALAVNLSDLAAMGAKPRWFTLALTLPAAEPAWLEAFARGLFGLAERYAVGLVGGDLTRGPLTVTIQVIGTVSASDALTRGGGRDGDDVYVTGSLGDGAAGLALIEQGERGAAERPAGGAPPAGTAGGDGEARAGRAALIERFLRPTPRVEAGLALAGIATAAIDVSDGLAADLGHLCDASGCGAKVDVEDLPLSAELLAAFPRPVAEAYALAGGDDYELCFTAPPARARRVEAALAACATPARRIGRLTAGGGILWRRGGQAFEPPAGGYMHF